MSPIMIAAVAVGVGVLVGVILAFVIGRTRRGNKQGDSGNQAARGGKEVIEIYVGNLSYEMSEKELLKCFEPYGKVLSARLIENKFNGKSKGYGFIEMINRPEAEAAVKALNGKEIKGRKMVANEAKTRAR
jgi:RNA recognition motif-containing protein